MTGVPWSRCATGGGSDLSVYHADPQLGTVDHAELQGEHADHSLTGLAMAGNGAGDALVLLSSSSRDEATEGLHDFWTRKYVSGDGWLPAETLATAQPDCGNRCREETLAAVALNDTGQAIAVWGANHDDHTDLWVRVKRP